MSVAPVTSFSQLALAAPLLQAIAEIGYEAPSPIQAATIAPLLEGRDLLGQAQTGTGKTAAFALPLLSRIDLARRLPQALVLTPTRELALQVAEAMQGYARHLPGFHILPLYGGQPMGAQLRQLKRGVQVVVGTPGRVMDHLRRGTLLLDALTTVVLDEADEMLRMGFIEDVEWILEHTPPQRQVALFSATMPEAIRRVAARHLREPVEVRIEAKTATVDTITQRYWQVSGLHKLDALTRLLEVEEFDAMIVFVRTKTATVELAEKLEARGYACAALNGDLSQAMREQTVERLKRGGLDIVVATDVAARGLDVERISHVVNFDIPYDTEAYVHRIGRTGRAGRKGQAILFVAPRERHLLRAIERAIRQPIAPMSMPSCAAIADRRIARFKQLITDTLESQDLGPFEAIVADYQAEHNVGLGEVAAALAFLVQRERPLAQPEACRDAERPQASTAHPECSSEQRAGRRERSAEQRVKRGVGRHDESGEPRMERYRIEVGREHGVQVKNIVGAIANEAGLESRYIGPITLCDTYSLVDLPLGMPKDIFHHLRKVWVCGRQLNIQKADAAAPDEHRRGGRSERPGGRPAPHGQGKRAEGEHASRRRTERPPKEKRGDFKAKKRREPAA